MSIVATPNPDARRSWTSKRRSRCALGLAFVLLASGIWSPCPALSTAASAVPDEADAAIVEIAPTDETVSLLDPEPIGPVEPMPIGEPTPSADGWSVVSDSEWGGVFRWPSLERRLVAGADYLLLRPTFGNAAAMYRSTTSGIQNDAISAVNFDFGYSSGVRGFIGYWLNDDWMVRFSYMNIAASDVVTGVASGNWIGGNGTAYLGPGLTQALLAGESIRSEMGVVLGVYDLELAGRLNDRSPDCCCGESRWEAAASAGIRFADSSVHSSVFNDAKIVGTPDSYVSTSRNFRGVGPRIALQGRRYLGPRSRWSLFATGGASLLVGSYGNDISRFVDGSSAKPPLRSSLDSQHDGGPLVVPNLDLSLGGSWQLAERTAFSVGWMVMYWGELGYAQQIDTNAQVNQIVPFPATIFPSVATSLAYDGVFFRLTHTF